MKTVIAVLMTLFVAIALAVSQEVGKKVDNHKFNKAEYLVATATGQVKIGTPVKGTLFFDNEKKTVSSFKNLVRRFSISSTTLSRTSLTRSRVSHATQKRF